MDELDDAQERTEPKLTDPFEAFWSFISYVEDTNQLLMLTSFAFQNMMGLGRLAQALKRPSDDISHKEKLERLATNELENGLPLLMSHTAVGLWSALEGALTSFVVDWLCYKPELLQGDAFAKTKVPAHLLSSGDFKDVATYAFDELSRQASAQLKPGVGRFSVILDAIGLSLSIDDGLRKTLFELSNVRNVYAHRFGLVDAKFIKACPWMKVEIGQRLHTSLDDIDRYMEAVRTLTADTAQAALDTLNKDEQVAVAEIHKARNADRK